MKFDKLIADYRKDILKGELGLMPIPSNKITLVYVTSHGFGRIIELRVDNEGRKQFEFIMEEIKKKYEKFKKKHWKK